MKCPVCDVEMKLIPAGVSKSSGKPYKAFYSCPECKETLNTETEVRKTILPPTPRVNGDDKIKSMVMAYAKDLVVAMMTTGTPPPDPISEVITIYKRLMTEIEK